MLRTIQARFVDDPAGAVTEAERVLEQVLRRATVSYRTLFEDLLGDDTRREPMTRGATR